MAEWKATWRKIEEGISITWEVFVAFLRIHRVTADGCTCANYCTFTMREGVLLWLLVKSSTDVDLQWSVTTFSIFAFGSEGVAARMPEGESPTA